MENRPPTKRRLLPGEILYDAIELKAAATVDSVGSIDVQGRLFSDLSDAAAYSLGMESGVSEALSLRYWHYKSHDGQFLPLLNRFAVDASHKIGYSVGCVSNLEPFAVQTPCKGQIIMVRCPGLRAYDFEGRYIAQDFASDVSTIRKWDPAFALSTIESHEYIYLGLPCHVEETFRSADVRQLLLPIPKGEILEQGMEYLWQAVKNRAIGALEQGQDILIHSGVDMGRAGYIAALLLIALGIQPLEAIGSVRAAHKYAIETFVQEASLLGVI